MAIPASRTAGSTRFPGMSAGCYVLDLLHVAAGGGRGIVLGAAALARDHVGGVPVPPVMRRGDRLERAVAVGRLVQEVGESLDLHGSAPREAGLDLLEQPFVAVGIAERNPGVVGAHLRVGAALARCGAIAVEPAAPVEDLGDLGAAGDEIGAGGLHVVDGE